MTNPPPPELFTERPVQSDFGRADFVRARSYRIRRIITILVLVGLIGGGSYSIYAWHRTPAEIPTVKAELPLKQKPEQPGGIDIPNQDVLAYQQIDNSGGKPAAEHLLPPPETPQSQPANASAPMIAPEVSAPPPIESLAGPPSSPSVATTVAPQHSVPPSTPPAVAQAPSPAPEPAPDAASAAAPPAPAAANPPPTDESASSQPAAKPAAGKKFRIQLASYPDKETATSEMVRIQKRYGTHLGPARLHLTKADLGARGIYWRVQSNPIADSEAHDICAALKNLKAGCIVVRP